MSESKNWLFVCPQCGRKMLLHESQVHASASCPHGRKRVEMERELLPRKEALALFEGKKPAKAKKRSSKSKNNTRNKSKMKRGSKPKKKNNPQQLSLGL